MLKQRKKPQRLQITERDLAIFESLSTARFLTAQALEWLHFPDWEARYKAWQERGKDAGPYEVSGRLYGRLRRFREVRSPLVHRIIRPVALSTAEFRRDADAYALAEGGAELLVEARRMLAEWTWPHERSGIWERILRHGQVEQEHQEAKSSARAVILQWGFYPF
jgi:hypothetical protein